MIEFEQLIRPIPYSGQLIRYGSLIRFRTQREPSSSAFARVIGLAPETIKRDFGREMLAVLVANEDLSFGYARYVDLDAVEFVIEPGDFTQWFMFGELPDKPQQIVDMGEHGSMSNSYLGRYLDTPLGAPVADWRARFGETSGRQPAEKVIRVHPRFVIDEDNTLAQWGDVNYMDHGGQLLVRGPVQGGEKPDSNMWIENVVPPEESIDISDEAYKWVAYRIEPEQLALLEVDRQVYLVSHSFYLRSVLEDEESIPPGQHESWLHRVLASVADSCDREMRELRAALCSSNIRQRSGAYIDIANHVGWHEFDSYPLTLTPHEAYTRYDQLQDCPCDYCELINEKAQLSHKDELAPCEVDRLGEVNKELDRMERDGKC